MESHKIHVPNHQPVFDFASKIWLELESPFCLVNSLKSEADHSWGNSPWFSHNLFVGKKHHPKNPSNSFKSIQIALKSHKIHKDIFENAIH
jgi:hypothetical protein